MLARVLRVVAVAVLLAGSQAGGEAASRRFRASLPDGGDNAILRFDLSGLPKDARVHRADLIIRRSLPLSGTDDDALVDVEIVPVVSDGGTDGG